MPPKNVAPAERFKFTEAMDEVILDSLLYQASIGQRSGGTFSNYAFNFVLAELQSKFPDIPWCKERFASRIKYIKRTFGACYDSFRNISKSGWGFNSITKTWDLEDEVWDEIIKVNPNAADWRGKPLPLFEKMEELFGKDRATGDKAVTAADVRARLMSTTKKQGQLIREIDHMVSQKEVELEGFSEFGMNEISPPTLNADSVVYATEISASQQGGNKGKGSRRKRKMDDFLEACNEMLTTSIDKVISAKKANPSDVLKCLEDIDFDQRYKRKAYFHLSKNRDDYDILVALPLEERASALRDILVEAQVINVAEASSFISSFM